MATNDASKQSERVLFTESDIAGRVAAIAEEISRDHAAAPPLLVCVLGGGLVLMADLLRRLTIPADVSFLSVGTYAGKDIRVMLDVGDAVSGRHVILVDGAIISGKTHRHLIAWLGLRGAASVDLCAMVAKETMPADMPLRYIGFRTDAFAVGYGIAHGGQYRGLPRVIELPGPTA
jgi:hypoxanthine phosphoribosyltransferase